MGSVSHTYHDVTFVKEASNVPECVEKASFQMNSTIKMIILMSFMSELRRSQAARIHVSDGFLRGHRHPAMGKWHRSQDPSLVRVPTRNEVCVI